MHQHTTQYAPIQPRPDNVELNASQESENLDIGLPNDFVDENLEELFGFGGHHLGNQYVQETTTEIAEHPLVETPPPENLQSTLDFSNVPKNEPNTSPDTTRVELVFPQHPLKANGISYFNEKGVLYTTHRLKDQKQVPFGIDGISDSSHPHTIAFMYASIPGNHRDITICQKHAAEYQVRNNHFMNITFQGQPLMIEENILIDGQYVRARRLPLVHEIGRDNDRTYHVMFNCTNSCLSNREERKKLTLNVVILNKFDRTVFKHLTQRVIISANAGRDAGVFKGAKRKSEAPAFDPNHKRERLEAIPSTQIQVKTPEGEFRPASIGERISARVGAYRNSLPDSMPTVMIALKEKELEARIDALVRCTIETQQKIDAALET